MLLEIQLNTFVDTDTNEYYFSINRVHIERHNNYWLFRNVNGTYVFDGPSNEFLLNGVSEAKLLFSTPGPATLCRNIVLHQDGQYLLKAKANISWTIPIQEPTLFNYGTIYNQRMSYSPLAHVVSNNNIYIASQHGFYQTMDKEVYRGMQFLSESQYFYDVRFHSLSYETWIGTSLTQTDIGWRNVILLSVPRTDIGWCSNGKFWFQGSTYTILNLIRVLKYPELPAFRDDAPISFLFDVAFDYEIPELASLSQKVNHTF